MKSTTTSTCSTNHQTWPILDNMDVRISIEQNKLDLPLDDLFGMAARVNKKRGFLFVSKILGKHIPVNPLMPLITSGLLAIEYYEQKMGIEIKQKEDMIHHFLSKDHAQLEKAYQLLMSLDLIVPDNPIIIGFAETATALGHGVFDCISGSSFIHTTRKMVKEEQPQLAFEEKHSHAVNQTCYGAGELFDNQKPIILVDDEMTTGQTSINIIREIQKRFPRKEYHILSILDWRTYEEKKEYQTVEKELDITINTISLISGHILFKGDPLSFSEDLYQPQNREGNLDVKHIDFSNLFTPTSFLSETFKEKNSYLIKETGRFGLTASDKEALHETCFQAATHLKAISKGNKVLCLGTGEFMYVPMKIASYMGDGVSYQSSTRSPIHPTKKDYYAIKNGYQYPNPEYPVITHYLYNIPKGTYTELFVFIETPVLDRFLKPLLDICKDRGIQSIYIVTFSKVKGSGNDES